MPESRPSPTDEEVLPGPIEPHAPPAVPLQDVAILLGLLMMGWGAEIAHHGLGVLVAGAAVVFIAVRAVR